MLMIYDDKTSNGSPKPKKKLSDLRLQKPQDDKSNKDFSFEEPAIEAPDCGDQSIEEEEKSLINALSFNTALTGNQGIKDN
jgi:hypothetical protein